MSFSLPTELFLAIRSYIPISDLRTHVCYYNASPRIAALYDSEPNPDLFWRCACWSCGVGRWLELDGDTEHPAFWRTLAVGLIEREGFCSHSRCGEALLEYNRERMRHAANVVPLLSVKQVWSIKDFDPDTVGTAHRVLSHLDFLDDAPSVSALDEARLRADADLDLHTAGRTGRDATRLADHPLMLRSFATEVPTVAIQLGLGDGMIRTRVPAVNIDGVTVLDVINSIHKLLDGRLIPDDIRDFLKNHKEHFPDIPLCDAGTRFRTLRAVHSVCPIRELKYSWAMALRTGRPYFMVNLK